MQAALDFVVHLAGEFQGGGQGPPQCTQSITAGPDQAGQHRLGHKSPSLLFLLQDDLRQGDGGQLFTGGVVHDPYLLALAYEG